MQDAALRWLAACAVAFAGLFSLIGSEKAASRQEDSGRIVVTYWEKWTGDEMQAMKKVVDAFNASQDRIFVKYFSISGVAEKTLLATSGGAPPDVAGVWNAQVVQFADAGALTDLTEMAHKAGLTEADYIPAYWREMTYKGRLFALPTSPGTSALYVNRSLMPKEYKDPKSFPKDLEGFDRLVEKTTRLNPDGSLKTAGYLPRFGWGVWAMPYLFGGSYWENGRININGPDDIKAWTWVTGYTKRYGRSESQAFQSGFGNGSSSQNPFMVGKIAILMEGPWFSNFIRLYGPKMDWYAAPFPYPNGRPDLAGYTMLNLNTLVIPKGAKQPQAAFEFLRFVQRQRVMEQLCTDQRCNTPLAKVSESFFKNHPNKSIRLFDALARSPRAVPTLQIGVMNQISTEIGYAVDQAELGQKSLKDALDEAQDKCEKAWAKYQKQVLWDR